MAPTLERHSVGRKPKPEKKVRVNTKLDADIVDMARIISNVFKEDVASVLSEAARPSLTRRHREAVQKLNERIELSKD